jgi:hypothetical protein
MSAAALSGVDASPRVGASTLLALESISLSFKGIRAISEIGFEVA